MRDRLKFVAIVAATVIAIAVVMLGAILFAGNREAYWQWRLENNVAMIIVSIFTLFIVWLIVKEIRNKRDN